MCVSTRETKIIAHAGGFRSLPRILFAVTGFGAHDTDVRANCVRPLNVPRSLTAIYSSCLRTVSHIPSNPGQTPRFTGRRRFISLLREVLDGECVGAIWCASARAEGINFPACTFNHSDISRHLESTVCERPGRDYPTRRRRRLSSVDHLSIQRFRACRGVRRQNRVSPRHLLR